MGHIQSWAVDWFYAILSEHVFVNQRLIELHALHTYQFYTGVSMCSKRFYKELEIVQQEQGSDKWLRMN